MDEHIKKINEKLYDNLTYASKYGPDWIFSFFIILSALVIITYISFLNNKDELVENWNEVRCHPQNMVLAGYINAPEDGSMSETEYAKQNFQGCLNDVAAKTSYEVTYPYYFQLNIFNKIWLQFADMLNNIRKYIDSVRSNFADVMAYVLGCVMNMVIEFQKLLVSIKDFGNKIIGILTSAIMGTLGLYYTLVSGFKALFQFLLLVVISSTVLAIAMAFSFIGFPLAIALLVLIGVVISAMVMMSKGFPPVMGGLSFPGVPKKPRFPKPRFPSWLCFDKSTKINMNNGKSCSIKDIKTGDILQDGNLVNGVLKLSGQHEKNNMYLLNNIIVSGNHKVLHLGKWINVKEHPDSSKYTFQEKFLYNLITSNGIIQSDNETFKDYDEMQDYEYDKLNTITSKDVSINNALFKTFIGGFVHDTKIKMLGGITKEIDYVDVGDVLLDNVTVLGVVEINSSELENNEIKLTNSGIVCNSNLLHCNSLGEINPINNDVEYQVKTSDNKKMYHLITDKKFFYVGDFKFCDYDYLIDHYLE
jgi:hypothetical protein